MIERFECRLALDDELPPCDQSIAAMHHYWRAIRPPDARLPGRQHFDPAAIRALLPQIRLYDVFRDPWRFRYRLFGTELVRIHGRDLTGRWVHEVADPNADYGYRHLVFVAEGRGIGYQRGFPAFAAPQRNHLTAERILLPLARNGRDVDMVIGFTENHPVDAVA